MTNYVDSVRAVRTGEFTGSCASACRSVPTAAPIRRRLALKRREHIKELMRRLKAAYAAEDAKRSLAARARVSE